MLWQAREGVKLGRVMEVGKGSGIAGGTGIADGSGIAEGSEIAEGNDIAEGSGDGEVNEIEVEESNEGGEGSRVGSVNEVGSSSGGMAQTGDTEGDGGLETDTGVKRSTEHVKMRKKTVGASGKGTSKKSREKKKKEYEKCAAFLCQEPGVDETGNVDWILCDVCEKWYHWDCVGILKEPKGSFNCGCNSSYYTLG